MTANVFPAYIRAEYQEDAGGFPAFQRASDRAFASMESKAATFGRSFDEAAKIATHAIAGIDSAAGKMDLGTGQFRQAAADARLSEESYRALERAVSALAKETGDTSAATQLYRQALGAHVIEARKAREEAEAQVKTYTRLQQAIDLTADSNSRLAQSYRETFAEAAKSAQAEVRANGTQSAYNSVIAPGLTSKASANGATFSALQDDLFRFASAAEKAAGTAGNAIDRMFSRFGKMDDVALSGRTLEQVLNRVDSGAENASQASEAFRQKQIAAAEAARRMAEELARQNAEWREQASLISAQVASQSAINNLVAPGLTSRSTQNGAGYGALAAEMERVEASEKKAAIAAREYKNALFELRQQVDPAIIAQQRFDREVGFAGEAMRRGDINAEQYAKRLAYLTAEMQQNTQTTRQTRFASVQLGQQLQDSIIQAQMGTNAFVILAQQGSQTAYVLSGLGGTVGKVATFMAGWQGAIIFAALALGGQLLPALMGVNDKTKDASKSTIDFTNALETSRAFVVNYTNAVEQLNSATRGLINTQALLVDSLHSTAVSQASALNANLDQAQTRIAELEKKGEAASTLGLSGIVGSNPLYRTPAEELELYNLRKNVVALRKAAANANLSVQESQVALETRRIKEAFDPLVKEQGEINRAMADLERRRADTARMGAVPLADGMTPGGYKPISGDEYSQEYTRLLARQKALDDSKKKQPKDNSAKEAERAANAAARLAERGDDAAKKIANITDRFSELPPHVRTINVAMRELDDLADDFSRKKPPNYGEIVTQLEKAREVVRDALNKPFDDLILSQSEQLLIMDQQRQGLTDQATAMQHIWTLEKQMGPLGEQRKQAILDMVQAQRLMTREMEIQQEKQQIYLDGANAMRSTMESFARTMDVKSLAGGMISNFKDLSANVLSERLFGDVFRDIEDGISGVSKVKDAQEKISEALLKASDSVTDAQQKSAKATENAITKLSEFSSALAKATGVIDPATLTTSGNDAPIAANDNSVSQAVSTVNDIVVTANKGNDFNKSPLSFYQSALTKLFERFLGEKSPLAAALGKEFAGAIQNAAYGQMAGSLALGGGGSSLGAGLGGVAGGKLGEKVLQPVMEQAFGQAIGSLAGPLGSALGGIAGGVIGGLFKSKKYGTATIGGSDGSLAVTGTSGNSRTRVANSSSSANSVISSIEDIADQLGAYVDSSLGKVSIGQYDGHWRVSTTGYTGKLNYKGDTSASGKGLYNFDDDLDAALEFATMDLIKDGVLNGLRAGSLQLLQNADDLQTGLSKALKFEGVFSDLLKYKDPVRAAIEDLNKEYNSLITIFKEAGATTAEVAQLEELYNIKRQEASEQAISQLTSSLQSLYDTLTIGDSGLSLTTRLANAQAAYDPLAERVAAGDTTAYDDYAAAAQTLLDLQREYSGSMPEYFDLLNEVTSLTKGELDRQQSLIDAANGISAPDFSTIVTATESQTSQLLAKLNEQTNATSSQNAEIIALLRQIAANDSGSSLLSSTIAAKYGF